MKQNTPEGPEARMTGQDSQQEGQQPCDFNEISKLLRLKRYEQPGDHYFECFIAEFHRRQREDFLRVSPIRLWFERLQASLDGVAMGRWAYGGAVAVFAVTVAAVSLNGPAGTLKQAQGAAPVAQSKRLISLESGSRYVDAGGLGLGNAAGRPSYEFSTMQAAQAQQVSATQASPVYVLDARPVSYEPPFSF
jgi:hypothetical protein